MGRIGIPDKDAQFRDWADNFAAKAGEYETELGLTPEQVASLLDAAAEYYEAFSENQRLRSAYQGSTARKHRARENAETLIRSIGRVILIDPSISTDIKSKLGMKASKTPVSMLASPTHLSANPLASGINCLRWRRNGNSVHTMFIVEARIGDSPTWSYVGATTKLKFNHMDQQPGLQVTYRVSSQRGDKASIPSNQATVYGPQTSRTNPLPKAA